MRRRRIWCEFLPPQELGSAATINLLTRFELRPIIALPPGAENQAMASALARLQRAQIEIGLWPLLRDDEGYWPSTHNWRAFLERSDRALDFASEAGVGISTLAIDLEPPLSIVDRLLAPSRRQQVAALAELHRRTRDSDSDGHWREAVDAFTALSQRLSNLGVESLAVAVPPAIVDAITGGDAWQRMFATPLFRPRWTTLCPILYTSMIAAFMPGSSARVARAVMREASYRLQRRAASDRLCVSLGVVGPGKLGDEVTVSHDR